MILRDRKGPWNGGLLIGGLVIALGASACAHVNRDDLDQELAQIREEMREGNETLEQRLGEEIRGVEDRLERRISMLEQELNELRDEFNVTVERMENAIRFNTPIHFAFDDDALTDEYRPLLDRFAQVVSGYYEDAIITVEGFTDPAGSPQYNLQLGERRAQSVMEYLSQSGIPGDRMRAVSYGEAEERQVVPGARGPGEEGWQNRRVAMVIDFGPEGRARVVSDETEGVR